MTKRELWNECGKVPGLQEFIRAMKEAGVTFSNPPVRIYAEDNHTLDRPNR